MSERLHAAKGRAGGPLPPLLVARSGRYRIARHYADLTPAEQRVADMILERPERLVDQSIGALAREAAVAPAVVSHFVRSVGFASFRALRVAVAQDLAVEAALGAMPGPDGPRSVEEAPMPAWRAARTVALNDAAALHYNLDRLDPAAMAAAATMLVTANRVLTLGNFLSGAVAKYLASLLARQGWRARAETDPSDALWAEHVEAGDVVVVVSDRGRAASRDLNILPALAAVKTRGARLLAMTSAPNSPLGRAADVVLTTHIPGNTKDDGYVFQPVLPLQVATARALAAATIAARHGAEFAMGKF